MTNNTIPRYNIDSCALIVEFSAPVWTARKLDRTTTDEVVSNKNAAAKDAARVNKHLLAGRSELDVITTMVNRARSWVNTNTLPWSDNGQRLLPATQFLAFDKKMKEFETEFDQRVSDFITIYPSLITAQAMALGDMFRRDDYPLSTDLPRKFSFRFNYLPVPTMNDFRIDVGNEAQREIQAQMQKLADKRVDEAMADIKERLRDHMKRMSDRLSTDEVDGEVKKRRFHDTVIDGALELCDLIKSMNLTNDPGLEDARKSLEMALVGITPVEIRKNEAIREDLKKEVDSILDKFSF